MLRIVSLGGAENDRFPSLDIPLTDFTDPRSGAPIEYAADDVVRSVNKDGYFSYRGTRYKTSQAFTGQRVALRPTSEDGIMKVFFCHQNVASIDLRQQVRI